jgi:aryl-alcohol dehydrogenase-like predicted oxidoreductase
LTEYCPNSEYDNSLFTFRKGILTGKYSPTNVPTGFRGWRYNRSFLTKIEPLLDELREIGKQHEGKTPGQVSLNWLIAKGAVPIPGAKDVTQAKENAGTLGWQLSSEEVERLDKLSANYI